MTTISAMMILLIISFVLLLAVSRSNWENLRTRMKRRIFLLSLIHLFLFISLAYASWPLLPAGQEQRSEAIEAFLSTLRSGDVETAMNMIVPAPEDELTDIRAAFAIPENRPVSWEVSEPNWRDYAFGEVAFADGQTLDLFIGLEWEWKKARWGIIMLEFGRDQLNNKSRFYLYSTFLPYSWFRGSVHLFSLFCILFTVWQVRRLRKERANLQAQSAISSNQAHNF